MRSVFSFSAVCSAARMSINLLNAVVARLNDRNRIATFIEKLIFPKNQSSLHKRRRLKNCEKGMEFLTRDGCEDEYNK